MDICLQGYNSKHATFALEGDAALGSVVSISANNTVSACAASAVFAGTLISKSGEYALVQTSGFMTLPFTGTAPALGQQILAADGTGGVKTAYAGRTVLVCSIDPTAKTVSFIL